MWNEQPWGNDQAADWFARQIGDSGFAASIRHTFQQIVSAEGIDDEYYVLRAATYCLLQFAHVHVWPIDDLASDIRLAIAATERVMEEIDEASIHPLLAADLEQLKRRLHQVQ